MRREIIGLGLVLLALEASAVVAFKDAAKIKSWDAWKDSGATPGDLETSRLARALSDQKVYLG